MNLEAIFGLRPFTRRQALEAGLTPWQWQMALASGNLHRFRRNVYCARLAPGDRDLYLQHVAAGLLGRTNHLACSTSALAVLGLPNPYFTSWMRAGVTLAGPRSDPGPHIRANTGLVPVPTPWGPTTDLVDTAATIAAELPLPQALMVTDAAARSLAGTTDRFELASHNCRTEVRRRLTEAHDHPALRLANPAAESPAESFYRGHMLLEGLPEPDCGVPMRGVSGTQYFVDLLLDDLVIEVDGRLKYTNVQVVIDEKVREDDLRGSGLAFLRPFVEDLYADASLEMQRLRVKRAEIHRARRRAS